MFETLTLGRPLEPVMADLACVVEMKTVVLAWR
jgi:hypothetical protein